MSDQKLVPDIGSNFTASFDAVFQASGTRILSTAVQAPRINATTCHRSTSRHQRLLRQLRLRRIRLPPPRRHLPARLILPLASQMCRMLAGHRITQASPLGAIARAAVPVLLIDGGADTCNPTAMAHELHAAQPHADLWIVPGADHVMLYFTDPALPRTRRQFLRRQPQA